MGNKSRLTATFLFLALLVPTAQVQAHAEHGQSQYGGVHAEAGEAQFEIVAKGGTVTVYVSNHGAPVDATGATGKLTVLAGTAKSELELKAAGKNLLQGAGEVPAGAKLLLNVQLPGKKALQARAVMR